MTKERPILFSGAMVRAILDGRKTQTRRVAKEFDGLDVDKVLARFPHQRGCPYGESGDRLWVRETFRPVYPQDPTYNGGQPIEYDYQATYRPGDRLVDPVRWNPSIHMPRAACRLELEITGVRVERLNDCSEADAIAEGIEPFTDFQPSGHWKRYRDGGCSSYVDNPIASYASLWTEINGPGAWEKNPWVWVVEFRRIA